MAIVTSAGPARGAADPLLVVVEAAPGTIINAADVRRAISAELGEPVLAPSKAAFVPSADILVVVVDKTEIRMSFHPVGIGFLTRTISAPSDRLSRLREIGWLAGNLARDQVSGIVALPDEPSAAPAPPKKAPVEERRPATEPPPIASAPPPPRPMLAVALAAPPVETPAASGPRWALTATAGPTTHLTFVRNEDLNVTFGTYQFEIQRQPSPDGLILGGAVELGTGHYYGAQVLGFAGFVGSAWYRKRWFFETAVGLGWGVSSLEISTAPLFLRGAATVGLPISGSLDLVARIGLHVAAYYGVAPDFISATAGLRFRVF